MKEVTVATDDAIESSVLSAGPDRAVAVFVDHADHFAGEFVRVRRSVPLTMRCKSARGSDPQSAAAVFIEREAPSRY